MADESMWSNLMDIKRAAELLGLSTLQVRSLVAEKAIPVVMVGPFVRLARDDIVTWQRQRAAIHLADSSRTVDVTDRPKVASL